MMYLKPPRCSLEGYKIPCSGELQGGHIIHKGEVLGNAKARAMLAACPPEIMTAQCEAHNVGRLANSREAKRIQLLQKIYEYGYIHMEEWFDAFHETFKIHRPELELRRLLL